MSKKINPRRVPVSKADIDKVKRTAENEAIRFATSLVITVLRDKFGFGPTRLQRVWTGVEELADSVAKGYVTKADLEHTLMEEANIRVR